MFPTSNSAAPNLNASKVSFVHSIAGAPTPSFGNTAATSPAKAQFIQNAAGTNTNPAVDPKTLANFKSANPGLTPNAQDYAVMNGAQPPQSQQFTTPSGAKVDANGNTTPPPSQTSPSDIATLYKGAYDDYAKALTPSDAEKNAQAYINRLLDQASQDQIKAQNSGETTGFSQGMQRLAQQNNQAAIDSATRGLSTLTGYRTADANAAKARADYLSGIISAQKPVSVAAGSSLINPLTGETVGGDTSGGLNSLADKSAESTFYDIVKNNPDANIVWDPTKTSQENLQAAQDASVANSAGSLGQQLVEGQLAPSELSKRSTGASSYNAALKAANDYSMKTYGVPFDIAKADRDYKYANQPATQNTLNYLGALVGGQGQTGNLDELVTQSDAIPRTSYPALNDVQAWTRLQTGNPQVAAYYATVTEVADQVAKILQGGGTGSGTSDAKLAQAQSLFQRSFTPDQIKSVANSLKPLLANRAKSMIGGNPYLSDYADQFGFTQTRGSRTSTSSSSSSAGSDPLGIL